MSTKRKTSVFVLVATVIASAFSPAWCQDWEQGYEDARKSQGALGFQKAAQYHQAGDLVSAIKLYKQALGHDPRNKNAHYYLALAYDQVGDEQNASLEFKNALNIDYNFIQCRNSYGEFLRKHGDREGARNQFTECIKINPRFPDAYYHLGQILQEKGDLNSAISAYETATQLKPDYFEAKRDLGLAIYERSESTDISQALDKLLEAAKLVPNNPMIHHHLGVIYCADGKLDDAESEFRQALMIDPQIPGAHFELAKLRYLRGDLDRSIVEIREGEKANAAYVESKKYPRMDPLATKKLLALSLEYRGRKAEAVDVWKELKPLMGTSPIPQQHIIALERELKRGVRKSKKGAPVFNPEEYDALISKGQRLYDDGELEAAQQAFVQAAQMNPQGFEAMQNWGTCMEAAGDLNGAMAKYQAAMALKPTFDGAYYNIAYVLEKLNLPAEAGLMYQKFHEIAGRYPYDPKHIVSLQQDDARQRARQEQIRRRGY